MDAIRIEKYQLGQEYLIHQLVKKVYDEFVAPDYSEEGNQFFYDWIQPSMIAKRQIPQNNVLLAFANSHIVGMIEVRDNMNISLLFVDKQYQGRGIAKQLFREILSVCIQRDPALEVFYVHASLFSIPVYRQLGFVEIDSLQETNGIKYMPMKLAIY